tara:strand:- start:648 stop:1817 length:1170 start_codon:yes stop_codon:yes gene_type:complete
VKSLIIRLFCSLLSFIVPPKKNLYLFGSWYGNKYGDNSRYFFEWLSNSNEDVECYWFTRNDELFKELKAKNINVLYAKGLKVSWLHFRASAVFCNCSPMTDLLGEYLNRKAVVFNLWHGTPIKKIGFDAIVSDISSERLGLKRASLLSRIMPKWIKAFGKWLMEKELYYLASSEKVATLLSSAMGVDKEHIIVNGYPKLDHLITSPQTAMKGSILYAPTYRGEYNSENDLLTMFGFDAEHVDAWLEDNHKSLTIRLHPANTLPQRLIEKIMACKNIKIGGTGDLYEEITSYELIVTDFSSLFYDAISVNIKTVIAPFGLAEYQSEDRQLYFSPEELFPHEMASTWPELLALLPVYFSGEFDLTEVKAAFYCDDKGRASEVLREKISKIL